VDQDPPGPGIKLNGMMPRLTLLLSFFFLSFFLKQSSSYIFFNETKISSVMKRMCRTEDVYRDSVRV
jgi:hypothetical protein